MSKSYITTGNRFVFSPYPLLISHLKHPAINWVQNSKRSKPFSNYCENGRTDCVLPDEIQNKIK